MSTMLTFLSLCFHKFAPLTNAIQRQRGFTLVEMAVVLVLMGIVMTMGLKMVVATTDNASFSETKSKEERIKIALVGFLRTNGRLPCPDNTGGVATGVEAWPCAATPDAGYGVLPWVTLGLPREAAQDGWGNYFTYAVANGVSVAGEKNWTGKTASATDFTVRELTVLPQTVALTIQQLDATGSAMVNTSSHAVVVILSHGKNGFGAKTTKVAARIPSADGGAGEITNATIPTATYVMRPVTDVANAFNGPYDDVLMYLTPQDLLQPLISEGTLKTCSAYCQAIPSCSIAGGILNCTAGVGFCAGSGAACTSGGIISCTAGAPQCAVPGTGCNPIGPIPVGAIPVSCP